MNPNKSGDACTENHGKTFSTICYFIQKCPVVSHTHDIARYTHTHSDWRRAHVISNEEEEEEYVDNETVEELCGMSDAYERVKSRVIVVVVVAAVVVITYRYRARCQVPTPMSMSMPLPMMMYHKSHIFDLRDSSIECQHG